MKSETNAFRPIAVVGQACVLPGALDPETLWENIRDGRDLLADATASDWRINSPDGILGGLGGSAAETIDRTVSLRGGYVRGFEERFAGMARNAEEALYLDPVFQWLLYSGSEAFKNAGIDHRELKSRPDLRAGIILGNLSYPTAAFSKLYETIALEQAGFENDGKGAKVPAPENRFMSGLPAHWLAKQLGCDAGAFALDAACASSLFALKLACNRLHDGTADVMLAGAVNAADSLFLHIGFTALQALSPSGRSRPFHREADGLVPAEGAALFVLKTLERATRDGDKILGVIRGIGLSNDGRSRGFLAPAESGQAAAMQAAYSMSGLRPADISLIECHATGTAVGDQAEIRGMREVFAGCSDIPIGSLKSNLGHLITASGAAGLMKVLKSFEHNTRPATLHVDGNSEVDALRDSPFRVLRKNETYSHSGEPRRAAVSSFGFGGNNGHVIVEEWTGATSKVFAGTDVSTTSDAVAVVAMAVRVGELEGLDEFRTALFEGDTSNAGTMGAIPLNLKGLPFPPRDLENTLGQQLAILRVAEEALEELETPPPSDRTGVFVGMQCDTEIARYGLRWRLADLMRTSGGEKLPDFREDDIVPALDAAGVIGRMPNIPANRINARYDFRGPSFTVSAEELSGIRALEIAARALRAHDLDVALVGAVDLSHEPVHTRIAGAVLEPDQKEPGDGALVFICKRQEDALRDGDTIHALIDPDVPAEFDAGPDDIKRFMPSRIFGHMHAANGLLDLAAAVLAARHGVRPTQENGRSRAMPDICSGSRSESITLAALGDQKTSISITSSDSRASYSARPLPEIQVYSAGTGGEILSLLESGASPNGPNPGPARLALVANRDEITEKRKEALNFLREWVAGDARRPRPPGGIYFRNTPLEGDLAFAFTGAASAYAGMGRELLMAFPELHEQLAAKFSFEDPSRFVGWAFDRREGASAFQQLCGSSYLCQIHALLSRNLLGLQPDAVLGLSSGETNSILAMDAWGDMEIFLREIENSGMYDRELAGEFAAVQRYRAQHGLPGKDWADWRLLAPVSRVRELVENEPGVRLTIINSAEDCVIGGAGDACDRIIQMLGRELAIPLGHGMAVHCPEVGDFEPIWRELHHRETQMPMAGVRFYSNYFGGAYTPDANSVAEALTGNAMTTIDFPRIIESAYNDGVRIFVEHGPRDLLGKWIKAILGNREHLAVSFDAPGESLAKTFEAVAQLIVSGVAMDYENLIRSGSVSTAPGGDVYMKSFQAHPEPIRLKRAPFVETSQRMEPAPRLAPIGEEYAEQETQPAPVPVVAVSNSSQNNPLPAVAVRAEGNREITARQFARQLDDLTKLHTAFLSQQQSLHDQFLNLNRRLLTSFASRRLFGSAHADVPAVVSAKIASPAQPITRRQPLSPEQGDVPRKDSVSTPTPIANSPVTEQIMLKPGTPEPRGRKFSREDLEVHAGGAISEIFGELFKQQDEFPRQVRMPEPPLLLADRVIGLDAEAGSMGLGTVWTETDVLPTSWYLNTGRMPAGIMIEAGQADLFLISYLGVDAHNRGERVYRLLGCELTYHGRLPAVGDTPRYDIHVDGHAAQGDIRLFFFHYDCRVGDEIRLSVRNGQAGFFTERELAESGGILWDAVGAEHDSTARLDAPRVECTRSAFSKEQVRAFSEGDLFACFGKGFEYGQTHVRPPGIQSERMLFLDEVTDLDPEGGPWERGYLRARTELAPDDWFFAGHFKNDPCMPGTLMFEGCLQAMAFYLAGIGYTIEHDGWLFEPVPDETYKLLCRGQATPSSREIVYEIFVEELHASPMPTVYADLLCTIDGLKAFHARRMGLRLVPDWPLTSRPELLANHVDSGPVARANGFPLGYASLLACAWGPPSDAFGEMYRRFDGPRTVPRLPGPPYHFMSRVTRTVGDIGDFREGARVSIEYDIPVDEWYFAGGDMPFAVLLEAALQPCGWLASYVGSTLTTDDTLFFRNLDGTAVLKEEVFAEPGILRTDVELTSISQTGSMIIQSFEVTCFLNDREIYEMKTVFGFFPGEALSNQVGLSTSESERELAFAPSDFLMELTERPERYFRRALHLPDSMLLMVDRITGYWKAGESDVPMARIRGEKDVDASEWFFKAHFFQDPVQPGSLGLEALLQVLQFYMLHENMDEGIERPRFESIQLGEKIGWKYRGQVVPKNKLITSEVHVLSTGRDELGPFARAEGWLWVDGKRIYHFTDFGLRIVDDTDGRQPAKPLAADPADVILDPEHDTWLKDHCPTYVIPVLPMMSVLDGLVGAAKRMGPGEAIRSLRNLTLGRWISFANGPLTLRYDVEPEITGETAREARLLIWREAADSRLSRFEVAAVARVSSEVPGVIPEPFLLNHDAPEKELPYITGAMFHGPAFQFMRSWREDSRAGAASAVLDAGAGTVPFGNLHQGLLDAGTHLIPADRLHEWSDEIDSDKVAYPSRIIRADFFEALPEKGAVRAEVRFKGFSEFPDAQSVRFPTFRLQWIIAQPNETPRVAVEIDLAYALFPKGPLGSAVPTDRRGFLRDRKFVPGLSLSSYDEKNAATRLSYDSIRESDWLAGTVEKIHGCTSKSNEDLLVEIAAKEHFARNFGIHPAWITINLRESIAMSDHFPYNHPAFEFRFEGNENERSVVVRNTPVVSQTASNGFDVDYSRDIWRKKLSAGPWPGEALLFGLIRKFTRRFVVEDPDDFRKLRGRNVLYLANHQVGIESILFAILAGGHAGVPLKTIAKIQHRDSYIGRLVNCFMGYPGVHPPQSIIYFDEDSPATFLDHLADFQRSLQTQKSSLMVHAEASRAYSAHHEVEILSQVLVDFAIEMDFPIVPVWFAGGLPVETQTERIEFPYGYGSQDYYLGHSVSPDELRGLNGVERVARVLTAINAAGPAPGAEHPNPPDANFGERVRENQSRANMGEIAAVMRTILEDSRGTHSEIDAILTVLQRENFSTAALQASEFAGQGTKIAWMRNMIALLTEA